MFAFDKETQERIFYVAEARADGKELEGVELEVAKVLDLHPEFDDLWPQGDVALIARPIDGQIVNPFVHVVLHGIISVQLRNDNPVFVAETLMRLKENGAEEHEALHAVMGTYGDLHFRGIRQGGQFDLLEYESLLLQMMVDNGEKAD